MKSKWRRIYLLALTFLIHHDPLCRICREEKAVEGHHPWGQIGAMILLFLPVCRRCHDWVEGHKSEAREYGLIQY